ncbi:hypothetical protein J4Q44_G00267840 [Coregonus suidteri]|uniref:Uncharacterized protein n=1 Tax=Coregonus suidteri TaxID=861788 RepID=A0AAN8L6D3_9TELE
MSRRGAQGFLKGHEARPKPGLVRLNLLEGLRSTFNEWCTEVSMKFLYGPDHFSKMTIETKKTEEEEEELDEDGGYCRRGWGWRGRRVPRGSQGGHQLQPQTTTQYAGRQELGLRVREFYKGEEAQRVSGKRAGDLEGGGLPLVDSHAQHLIQKRITVKKLTRGLRNIVGPLRLTMTDVSSDLNNLVRTFRLSEVSPVVREALERPTSVEYLSILMQELPLQDQDLQSLVQLLKTIAL